MAANKDLSEYAIEKAKDLYAKGASCGFIGKYLGLSRSGVWELLVRNGVETRPMWSSKVAKLTEQVKQLAVQLEEARAMIEKLKNCENCRFKPLNRAMCCHKTDAFALHGKTSPYNKCDLKYWQPKEE